MTDIVNQIIATNSFMGTLLLLIVTAMFCFVIFYKSIEWFEKI